MASPVLLTLPERIVEKKYVVHLSMLSTAVCILLQKSISKEQLEIADSLLTRYVIYFQKYFGKENMVLNVHLLTHITQGVLNWGPLWTHNCFLYEGKNRNMLQMYQSPNQVVKQLVRKFVVFGNIPNFIYEKITSENTVLFCQEILNRRMRNFINVQGVVLLGSGKRFQLSDEETLLFQPKNLMVDRAEFFECMLYRRCRFSVAEQPNTKKQTNNSYVLITGGKFAQIRKIFRDSVENHVYIIVQLLKIKGRVSLTDKKYGNFVTHFVEVEGFSELIIVNPENIVNICVFFDTPGSLYVCAVPYGCWSG